MIPLGFLKGNNAGGINFTNIPAGYAHLQVRCFVRGTRSFTGEQLYVRFNGDGGNNYSYHYLYSSGGGLAAFGLGSTNVMFLGEFPAGTETANIYSSAIIDVLDYSDTTKAKTLKSIHGFDNNNGTRNQNGWLGSGTWNNTAAITSVTVLSNGPFSDQSSFALYGIPTSSATGA
jgi:hypothetical protein